MKKNWVMMGLGFCLLIFYLQSKPFPVPVLAANPEPAPVETQGAVSPNPETGAETPGSLTDNNSVINSQETLNLPAPDQAKKTKSAATDFQLAIPDRESISNKNGESDQLNENSAKVIEDSLPQKPEEPDTLSKIFSWWSNNPVKMKLWYLIFLVSTILFLIGRTALRRPLLFITLIIIGFYLGNNPNPIGSIFTIPIQKGEALLNSIILVSIPVILSLLFGRFFCGWACPLGAIQEFIHPESFSNRLPESWSKILAYLRFLILIVVGILSWLTVDNIWKSYDPFAAFFTFKWELTATILLIITLVASLLVERPFCRYLCPLGAILSLTGRISILKMRPDSEKCIACGKCSQPEVCPMNVISADNPYTDLPAILPAECIMCRRCATVCRYSALKVSIRSGKRARAVLKQNSNQNLSI